MSVDSGRSGPTIVLRDGQLVEENFGSAVSGGPFGSPRRLVVARSRLYLGCTALSADAVEFAIPSVEDYEVVALTAS